MARIGFIGLGNMGGPMAVNLVKAGHTVAGFDVTPDAVTRFAGAGGATAKSAAEAAANVDVIVTMLPAGAHVRDIYLGDKGLIALAKPGTARAQSPRPRRRKVC